MTVTVEALDMARLEVTEILFDLHGPEDERTIHDLPLFSRPLLVEQVILTTTEDLDTEETVVDVTITGKVLGYVVSNGTNTWSTHPRPSVRPLTDAPVFIRNALAAHRREHESRSLDVPLPGLDI